MINMFSTGKKKIHFTITSIKGLLVERFLPTDLRWRFGLPVEMTGHQVLRSRKLSGHHDHLMFPQILMAAQFSTFFSSDDLSPAGRDLVD